MNMLQIVSLIVLVVVIAIGFWRKINVGLLAVCAAVILGRFAGLSDSEIIKNGFNSSLFMTLLGVTMLSAIAQSNDSLNALTGYLMSNGKKTWMVPILIWIIGAIAIFFGPASLAIVCALSVPLAAVTGYNPVMLALIGEAGVFAMRFMPFTSDGQLIANLVADSGIVQSDYIIAQNFCAILVSVSFSVCLFFAFKGHKVSSNLSASFGESVKFTKQQIQTLIGFAVMLFLTIVVKVDVGMACFLVSTILIAIGATEEKKSIAMVPWSVIIMISFFSLLMKVITACGGIELLTMGMTSIMSAKTATAITGLASGILSWFSSASGVVYPTFMPMVGDLAFATGCSSKALITVVGLCASYAGISPASTGGALLMAACATTKGWDKEKNDRLFVKLFMICIAIVAGICLSGLLGVFDLICAVIS